MLQTSFINLTLIIDGELEIQRTFLSTKDSIRKLVNDFIAEYGYNVVEEATFKTDSVLAFDNDLKIQKTTRKGDNCVLGFWLRQQQQQPEYSDKYMECSFFKWELQPCRMATITLVNGETINCAAEDVEIQYWEAAGDSRSES